MKKTRSLYATALFAGVSLALLAGAGAAQARDVYWSVGVNSPGVVVGVSNGGFPAYVAPAPVYVAPQPIYYQAPPVSAYYAPPRPVYVAPPAFYPPPPPGYFYRERGHHHHHHRDFDRGGRWER